MIKNIDQPLLGHECIPPAPSASLWVLNTAPNICISRIAHRILMCCWPSHSAQLRLWTEQTLPCVLTYFSARPPFLSHGRTRCPSPPRRHLTLPKPPPPSSGQLALPVAQGWSERASVSASGRTAGHMRGVLRCRSVQREDHHQERTKTNARSRLSW